MTPRFSASPGPQGLGMFAGIAVAAVILVGGQHATGVSDEGIGIIVVAMAVCGGCMLGSIRVVAASQRSRWIEAVGAAPEGDVVVALSATSVLVWDAKQLKRGITEPMVEIPREGLEAERWPAWAEGGGGVRLRLPGQRPLGLSVSGDPRTGREIARFLTALAARNAGDAS